MDWKRAIATLSIVAVVTSGTVGFSYSLESKKLSPFVKVKRSDIGLTGKTEMTLAYDFGYKIFSGAIERQDIKLRPENYNPLTLPGAEEIY